MSIANDIASEPAPEVRERVLDWLLDVIDERMVEDVGEVATPLDYLPEHEERRAVMWLRERVAALHDES